MCLTLQCKFVFIHSVKQACSSRTNKSFSFIFICLSIEHSRTTNENCKENNTPHNIDVQYTTEWMLAVCVLLCTHKAYPIDNFLYAYLMLVAAQIYVLFTLNKKAYSNRNTPSLRHHFFSLFSLCFVYISFQFLSPSVSGCVFALNSMSRNVMMIIWCQSQGKAIFIYNRIHRFWL